MDQQHEEFPPTQQQASQQHQQQPGNPAPIAPNPNGLVMANAPPGQGMLMGLMTNPALAAAAAASPLFPPAAVLTNPGAFFAMPDVFASSGGSATSTSQVPGHVHRTSV